MAERILNNYICKCNSLLFHKYMKYIYDNPTMPDDEYDEKLEEIREFEKCLNADEVYVFSPTIDYNPRIWESYPISVISYARYYKDKYLTNTPAPMGIKTEGLVL